MRDRGAVPDGISVLLKLSVSLGRDTDSSNYILTVKSPNSSSLCTKSVEYQVNFEVPFAALSRFRHLRYYF